MNHSLITPSRFSSLRVHEPSTRPRAIVEIGLVTAHRSTDIDPREAELERAIAAVQAQRAVLGDSVADAVLTALLRSLEDVRGAHILEPAALDAERKLVTILFADISGFTALSERLDAEAVREVINACFNALVPVIERYGGRIDKFIGDEIMALFGAPIAGEHDAEMALRAALGLMESIAEFNARRGLELSLHIGINSGRVVAGDVGSHERSQYSVMGSAVNLASRLCDAGVSGEIMVSAGTHRLTRNLFRFDAVPPLSLQGIQQQVAAFLLREALHVARIPSKRRRVQIVGRASELSLLQEYVAQSGVGAPQFVLIRAEPGIGKSTVIWETAERSSATHQVAAARGQSHMSSVSDWAVGGLMRELIGLRESSDADLSQARLHLSVAGLFADDDCEDVYLPLAHLIRATLDVDRQQRLASFSPEVLRRQIATAFRRYIAARSNGRGLLLICEDIHWWDAASLDLISNLGGMSESRLLVLLSTRPAPDPTVEQYARLVSRIKPHLMEIRPLPPAACEELLENLMGSDSDTSTLRTSIISKADGNPFFLEEVAAGMLQAAEARDTASRTFEVPATIEGVVAAKIDRLAPHEKAILQSASAIGRMFPEQLLDAVAPDITAHSRADGLRVLLSREMLRAGVTAPPTDEDGYAFRHALTHEVTYNSMLKSRRRMLHDAIGSALEQRYPARRTSLAAQIAYHYDRAENADKAVEYLLLAGSAAADSFANEEAERFYRSALGYLTGPDNARHVEGWNGLALVLSRTGRYDEARDCWERCLTLGATGTVHRATIRRLIGDTFQVQHFTNDAAASYEAALTILDSAGDTDKAWWQEWIAIKLEQLQVFYYQARTEDAQSVMEEVTKPVALYATSANRARLLLAQMQTLLRLNQYVPDELTLSVTRDFFEQARASASYSVLGQGHFGMGITLLLNGDHDQAADHLFAAKRIAANAGDVGLETLVTTYLAMRARFLGDVQAAAALATETMQLAERAGMQAYVAMALGHFAWVAFRGGDMDAALHHATSFSDKVNALPNKYPFLWIALVPLMGCRLESHDYDGTAEIGRLLLDPGQHALPQSVSSALRTAITAMDNGETEPRIASAFADFAREAREKGYM